MTKLNWNTADFAARYTITLASRRESAKSWLKFQTMHRYDRNTAITCETRGRRLGNGVLCFLLQLKRPAKV